LQRVKQSSGGEARCRCCADREMARDVAIVIAAITVTAVAAQPNPPLTAEYHRYIVLGAGA